jgi:hypothetical protein
VRLRLPTGIFHNFHRFNGGGLNQTGPERATEVSEECPQTMATETPLLVAIIGGAHALSGFVSLRRIAKAFHRLLSYAVSFTACGACVSAMVAGCPP